jgi:hypothetical protein
MASQQLLQESLEATCARIAHEEVEAVARTDQGGARLDRIVDEDLAFLPALEERVSQRQVAANLAPLEQG